ncbi:MAG: amidohydrolase family protein, partial [Oscillospiraceae bacterium]|nr:amidohydrolase family protein [Oscillospiraceae bacterium]
MTIKHSCICTDEELISYIGNNPPDIVYDRSVDLSGNLIIPGFCNAHTHSPMVFLRSFAEDLPLDRWLNEAVFPNEAKLTADDVYALSKLAAAEYVSGGTTSCFDMYFFPDAIAQAFADCGFRC